VAQTISSPLGLCVCVGAYTAEPHIDALILSALVKFSQIFAGHHPSKGHWLVAWFIHRHS